MMKNKAIAVLAGIFFAALSGTAAARDRISFSVSIGAPAYAYVTPAPDYYYPPFPPRVVYYAPPPPIYYAPPATVYYAPAPWAARAYHGHHRGWHRNH